MAFFPLIESTSNSDPLVSEFLGCLVDGSSVVISYICWMGSESSSLSSEILDKLCCKLMYMAA